MTQNSDGHFNLSSDTTKPFQPNPLSSDSAISTRHSNGTDAARAHNHDSFPPEADDTISDTGISAAPQAAKNTADDAKHETRTEETLKKKDSGSAIGRDPETDNEESTHYSGRVQSQFGDSSYEAKLGADVEATEGDVNVEEESFAVGDKVAIKVSENVLVELQEDYGGCTKEMTQVIPQRAANLTYMFVCRVFLLTIVTLR